MPSRRPLLRVLGIAKTLALAAVTLGAAPVALGAFGACSSDYGAATDRADADADADAATAETGAETGDGGSCDDASADGTACGTKVIEVGVGGGATCVVLASGEVWCWGRGQFMDLGIAPSTLPQDCGQMACSATPRRVPGVDGAIHLAMGLRHACALRNDGSVWCWGVDDSGQLGRDPASLALCSDPVGVPSPCGGAAAVDLFGPSKRAVQISTTGNATCARTDGGEVYCWGANSYAETGQPRDVADGGVPFVASPKKVPLPADDAVSVACGANLDCCVVRADGHLWCWGANGQSQLTALYESVGASCGTDGFCTETPREITNADVAIPFAGVKAAAFGQHTILALKTDGTVWAWGAHFFGALGDGTIGTMTAPTETPNPKQVPLPTAVAALSGNSGSEFAIDVFGNVRAWGLNSTGELALGNTDGVDCPAGVPSSTALRCIATPTVATSLAQTIQIEMSRSAGVALKKDGTVLVWGNNTFAQLGHAPSTAPDVACGTATYPHPCVTTAIPMTGLPGR
jgi:alpha-tubulin suppressor-like RCC1 family protein